MLVGFNGLAWFVRPRKQVCIVTLDPWAIHRHRWDSD
jgi:hypothetical protein